MKFTKLPADTFKQLQLNAGILLSSFDTTNATVDASNILGATSGGISFSAKPSFEDFGSDIDNCPKNTKELKKLTEWEATMSGTFASITAASIAKMVGAADVSGTKVTPRNDLVSTDFSDLWWVGDYSDKNGATNGGYLAVHLMNALSTGGFAIKSEDKGKGTYSFEFTGHYSIETPDTVPFEIYAKAGTAEAAGG